MLQETICFTKNVPFKVLITLESVTGWNMRQKVLKYCQTEYILGNNTFADVFLTSLFLGYILSDVATVEPNR